MKPWSYEKGKLSYWFVFGLISMDVNWKQTVGKSEAAPIANYEFLKSSILIKKYNATPNSWIKVMTWAASWESEKKDESINEKLSSANISKK